MVTAADIRSYLEEVSDPEIPVLTITDLGVVQQIYFQDQTWFVELTPTYSGCPAMQQIEADILVKLQEKGIAVQMTTANWLLIHNGATLYEHLAKKNIFMRNCASFGLENTYRIAVPAKTSIEKIKIALMDFEVEHE